MSNLADNNGRDNHDMLIGSIHSTCETFFRGRQADPEESFIELMNECEGHGADVTGIWYRLGCNECDQMQPIMDHKLLFHIAYEELFFPTDGRAAAEDPDGLVQALLHSLVVPTKNVAACPTHGATFHSLLDMDPMQTFAVGLTCNLSGETLRSENSNEAYMVHLLLNLVWAIAHNGIRLLKDCVYDLTGFTLFFPGGEYGRSGHYAFMGIHRHTRRWYYINDDRVSHFGLSDANEWNRWCESFGARLVIPCMMLFAERVTSSPVVHSDNQRNHVAVEAPSTFSSMNRPLRSAQLPARDQHAKWVANVLRPRSTQSSSQSSLSSSSSSSSRPPNLRTRPGAQNTNVLSRQQPIGRVAFHAKTSSSSSSSPTTFAVSQQPSSSLQQTKMSREPYPAVYFVFKDAWGNDMTDNGYLRWLWMVVWSLTVYDDILVLPDLSVPLRVIVKERTRQSASKRELVLDEGGVATWKTPDRELCFAPRESNAGGWFEHSMCHVLCAEYTLRAPTLFTTLQGPYLDPQTQPTTVESRIPLVDEVTFLLENIHMARQANGEYPEAFDFDGEGPVVARMMIPDSSRIRSDYPKHARCVFLSRSFPKQPVSNEYLYLVVTDIEYEYEFLENDMESARSHPNVIYLNVATGGRQFDQNLNSMYFNSEQRHGCFAAWCKIREYVSQLNMM